MSDNPSVGNDCHHSLLASTKTGLRYLLASFAWFVFFPAVVLCATKDRSLLICKKVFGTSIEPQILNFAIAKALLPHWIHAEKAEFSYAVFFFEAYAVLFWYFLVVFTPFFVYEWVVNCGAFLHELEPIKEKDVEKNQEQQAREPIKEKDIEKNQEQQAQEDPLGTLGGVNEFLRFLGFTGPLTRLLKSWFSLGYHFTVSFPFVILGIPSIIGHITMIPILKNTDCINYGIERVLNKSTHILRMVFGLSFFPEAAGDALTYHINFYDPTSIQGHLIEWAVGYVCFVSLIVLCARIYNPLPPIRIKASVMFKKELIISSLRHAIADIYSFFS